MQSLEIDTHMDWIDTGLLIAGYPRGEVRVITLVLFSMEFNGGEISLGPGVGYACSPHPLNKSLSVVR